MYDTFFFQLGLGPHGLLCFAVVIVWSTLVILVLDPNFPINVSEHGVGRRRGSRHRARSSHLRECCIEATITWEEGLEYYTDQ